jgi:hypothetical protein
VLIVATPLLAAATPRDLEDLGLGRPALQAISLAQRRRTLRAATGTLAPFLRIRYELPLVPTLDESDTDPSGLAGGAEVTYDGGPATLVQDVAIQFSVVGSVTSYALNTSNGAYGSAYGSPTVLSAGQTVVIDGYTVTFTGTINDGDVFAYSTRFVQDPGIAQAVCWVAARSLIQNRGVDSKTEQALDKGFDAAMAWAKALGIPGEGELDPTVDRTPTKDEYGPLFTGEQGPYDWLTEPGRFPRG